MQSPVGNHRPLEAVELDEGLVAWRCPESGGLWIPAENYWKWRGSLPPEALGDAPEPLEYPVSEYDDAVKLCPESGTLMSRFRVGHGLSFRVDRSNTGGIWLDGGEWETLRSGNLHRSIHRIFTSPWQRAIRHEERDASYHRQLVRRLGEDLFSRVQSLRDELENHPNRAIALAYLNAISSPGGNRPRW
ncbi:hypothetical protein [Luteolibacter marinus]|uniref:hypothetical protein n=1 Tax=Luteolibacter marinus TaxID=2776705 RepID=UPI0018666320|nr:hypothetical protein [Luteolibacter marinus]